MDAMPFGFRIAGTLWNDRRLVNWLSAFQAYCDCDEKSEYNTEGYLSAFTFGKPFRDHLQANRSTRGYTGESFALWLWFDIDREDDFELATSDARRLASTMANRYGIEDELLVFFSGSKGYHLGLPTSLWGPRPGVEFHEQAKAMAEFIAEQAGVGIDASVYDRVRAFRAPNSKHPKTGLHKRRFTLNELLHLEPSRIRHLGSEPQAFDVSSMPSTCKNAIEDWQRSLDKHNTKIQAIETRRATATSSNALNRSTLEFIREGATAGERAKALFQAAANLAELGCSLDLASALLTEPALDSGLTPNETRRQIESGIKHGGKNG